MKTPGIGDNSGSRIDEYAELVEDKLKGLDEWERYKDIPDEEVAERLRDYIAGVKGLDKDVDTLRRDEKQPFLDQAARVDDRWNPLRDRLRRALQYVENKLDRYMREKKRLQLEKEALARKAANDARLKKEAAEKAAADALRVSERIEAEARAVTAGKEEKRAERVADKAAAPTRVASATGISRSAGFAKERKATVVDRRKALTAICKNAADAAAIDAELERLANARIRASRGAPIAIPGFEITEQDKLRA